MLEGLDAVPWGSLRHAYGAAGDVPGLLQELLSSPDVKVLQALYANIYHQGTRYSASSRAVPFLMDIVEQRTTHRAAVLVYLVDLAHGYTHLDEGFAVKMVEALEGPELDCFLAAEACVPRVLRLLSDSDAGLRIAAAFAAAWIGTRRPEAFPEIEKYAHRCVLDDDDRRDEEELCGALLALGMLARAEGDDSRTDAVKKVCVPLLSDCEQVVRVGAAIALAPLEWSDAVASVLKEAAKDDVDCSGVTKVWFRNMSGAQTAMALIAEYGKGTPETLTDVFCESISEAGTWECQSMVTSLLRSLRPGGYAGVCRDELCAHELRALHAMADCKGWGVGGMLNGNFSLAMGGLGLPNTADAFAEYLGPQKEAQRAPKKPTAKAVPQPKRQRDEDGEEEDIASMTKPLLIEAAKRRKLAGLSKLTVSALKKKIRDHDRKKTK
eukprot:TRINITY_DN2273_c0_g3_i1.p1 TRINITY_DN2273_c0_g3~~TRINITY_DN2273_c0_g3_i1.p1  ORF type:complete len:438 (+),score=88.68 TRINITY_DN2273_c0_g3_i1:48-1361(+)